MKRSHVIWFGLIVAGALILAVTACSPQRWAQVQEGAADVHYVTTPGTTQPSTQPSTAAFLGTGQVVVQAASGANPLVGTIVGIVSIVSGVVGAFAATKATSGNTTTAVNAATSQLTATHNSVLTEVAQAITGVMSGPWSPVATSILQAAGLHDLADPNTPLPTEVAAAAANATVPKV